MLRTITLTGADERTDLDALVHLATDHPSVEIGLLYTATPEGRNRYPSPEWLMAAGVALKGRCAFHICGGTARRQLLSGAIDHLVGLAARIQVNGLLSDLELEMLSVAFARHDTPFITQHHDANKRHALGAHMRHCLLVDGSGGRGISPTEWLRPETEKAVGFAGGLGPDNLELELPKIAAVASGPSWVDMEGKLRTSDWFDIGLARECAEVFDAHARGVHRHPFVQC